MWKWKIVQLAFGRRLSLFLFHVWRKEPFGKDGLAFVKRGSYLESARSRPSIDAVFRRLRQPEPGLT